MPCRCQRFGNIELCLSASKCSCACRVSLPVVNTLLSIPVVRHVYGILGGCALDKNTLVNKLKVGCMHACMHHACA